MFVTRYAYKKPDQISFLVRNTAIALKESNLLILKEDLAALNEPTKPRPVCPKCGKDSQHWYVKDYDPIWRDGKVVCTCGTFIRHFDAD